MGNGMISNALIKLRNIHVTTKIFGVLPWYQELNFLSKK